jgi:hypothetical protein
MDSTIKGLFEMVRDTLNHGGDKMSALTALKTIADFVELVAAPIEGAEYTLPDLIKCVTRELSMRERVYGRKVDQGNMSQHAKDKEINQMTDVHNILKGLSAAFWEPEASDNQGAFDFEEETPANVHKITGVAATRQVFIDGKELLPVASQRIWNHSPDGFSWGYGGSGPAQLALAIILELFDEETAHAFHQKFKFDIIQPLQIDNDFEIEIDVVEWINEARKEVMGG